MNDHEKIKHLISTDYDGEATLEEKKIIQVHIKECAKCASYYKELNRLSQTLQTWPDEELSPDLVQKIRTALPKVGLKEESIMKPKFKLVTIGGGGLIAALIIIAVSMQTYSQRALQGRVRDAAIYATDNIGGQYSSGNTNVVKITSTSSLSSDRFKSDVTSTIDGKLARKAKVSDLGDTTQYKPYYLATDYRVKRNEGSQIALKSVPSSYRGRMDTPRRELHAQRKLMEVAKAYPSVPAERSAGGFQQSSYGPEFGLIGGIGGNDGYAYQDVYQDEDRQIYYPQSSEQYEHIHENPFLAALEDPLSTFSIDVDTTSYSNVRRFLNNNQLPPVDAVRIEELINYFTYDYPQPSWNQPFSITTEASLCPWNNQNLLVKIGLLGKTPRKNKIPPSNLVFLIDVSGSMNQPNKLPLLKKSFKMMVDQLGSDERIAIVTYAGRAGLVLDSTSGSEKWRIHQAIDNLRSGGSTAGAAGIRMAYDIAQRNFIRNGNNRVVLATDGDFNVGVSNDSELVRLIEDKRRSNIFLTILGFGTGNYKDAKMEKIADHGNGNYHYIDSLQEGKKVLVDELGSMLFTIAKDVKLQVEFNPNEVHAYRLIGYENRTLAAQDFNNDAKDAGELGAGHTVTALYEIVPAYSLGAQQSGVDPLVYQRKSLLRNHDLMTVKLRYKDPHGFRSKLIKRTIHRNEITRQPSQDFLFASAVAEFGLLLKNSPHQAYSSYQNALSRANLGRGIDKHGQRSELIQLIQKASQLDHRQRPIYTPHRTTPVYPMYEEGEIQFKGQ